MLFISDGKLELWLHFLLGDEGYLYQDFELSSLTLDWRLFSLTATSASPPPPRFALRLHCSYPALFIYSFLFTLVNMSTFIYMLYHL